jgi:hypothetical protein
MPVIDSIWNALVGCRHRRTTFPFTPARAKTGGVPSETHAETYVVCLDCGKQFVYDWENMRLGGAVDISNGAPVAEPPTVKVPFRTKSKMRYLLWGSALSAAVVIGKTAQARKRSTSAAKQDGQGDNSKDAKTPRSS